MPRDILETRHVEASGPWHRMEYEFNVGGYRVPHIEAALQAGTEDRWMLLLDRRFMLEVSDEEVQRWMPFLAHAMAIAAGYSCHGENCTPLNPFCVKVAALDAPPDGTEPGEW